MTEEGVFFNIRDDIAVTETWFDDSHTDNSVSIDWYCLLRRDTQGHAGGLCCHIRDDMAFNARPDLLNDDWEDLWVEILLRKSKPYIGVCYRNYKKAKLLKCLENAFTKLRTDCDSILFGDFNLCLVKNQNKLCKEYRYFLKLYNCMQLISSPTRVTDKTSSLLYHIFKNNPEKICQLGVLPVGLSDHYISFCIMKSIRGQIGRHKTIKIRSMKKYLPSVFLDRLRNANWFVFTYCEDLNAAWSHFKYIFVGILDEVAPTKHI